MEVVIFIFLVIIIILLVGLRSRQNEIKESTQKGFQLLRKELLEIKEGGSSTTKKERAVKPADEEVIPWRPYSAPTAVPEKAKQPEQAIVQLIHPPEQVIASIAAITSEIKRQQPPIITQPAAIVPTESWREKWLRNNPDLEKFVGENLVNKIGIAVLVLGIAFFVKYAIDQNWIKEIGRVCIGIGCGIILVGIAHYLRNSYRSFSSVMAGGGIAVFYFTIAFAFHEYQMFSQTIAFSIMVVIIVFAVLLSLLYNKIELAVIAVVGGFFSAFFSKQRQW